MKNLMLFCLAFAVLLGASCEKEEPGCQTGEIRFTNTSQNPYDLYINDEFEVRVAGNSFVENEFRPGRYAARVEQVSGFILFPTILENEITVFECEQREWVFP